MASLRRGRMCIYGFAFSTRRATPCAFVTAIELRYVPEGNYRSKPPAPDVLGSGLSRPQDKNTEETIVRTRGNTGVSQSARSRQRS